MERKTVVVLIITTMILAISFLALHTLILLISFVSAVVSNADYLNDDKKAIFSAVTGLLHGVVVFLFAKAEAHRDRIRIKNGEMIRFRLKALIAVIIYMLPLFYIYIHTQIYVPAFPTDKALSLYKMLNFQYVGIINILARGNEPIIGIIMLVPVIGVVLGYGRLR